VNEKQQCSGEKDLIRLIREFAKENELSYIEGLQTLQYWDMLCARAEQKNKMEQQFERAKKASKKGKILTPFGK